MKAAEDAFEQITAGVRWLSIEPFLEPLRFQHLERFDWMVIGGASETRQTAGSPATPAWRRPLPGLKTWCVRHVMPGAQSISRRIYSSDGC